MNWTVFRLRARMIQAIRDFFVHRSYLEIDAPILTPWPTLDNHILSIATKIHDMQHRPHCRYMHASPEHAMKKLLAAGSGNIFFLGKVFRDAELTRLHNPEFTMTEWYQIHATYADLRHETEALITGMASRIFGTLQFEVQNQQVDLSPPWPVRTVASLFKERAGVDEDGLFDPECLRSALRTHQIHFNAKDDWETLFHLLFMARIEPALGFPCPLFVTDYPTQMGLMAKRKPDDPRFVERVELYIGGLELANGYSELEDPDELRRRFEAQQRIKAASGHAGYPIDEVLLEILPDMPPCAGIALGADRLIMLLLNQPRIQKVIYFPFQMQDH